MKNRRHFTLTLTPEKIKETYNIPPEMKLMWLEEANNFINNVYNKKRGFRNKTKMSKSRE